MVAGEVWQPCEFLTDDPGIRYDSSTNTLTLHNFTGPLLDINLMGNGFTIKLEGENHLEMLRAWGFGYGGSVTFTDYYGTVYARTYYNGKWSNVSKLVLKILGNQLQKN